MAYELGLVYEYDLGRISLIGKIISGWIMITLCYCVTYGVSASLYYVIFRQPIDYDWNASGMFMGSFLLVIPYILAGLYARKVMPKSLAGSIWLSLVPVIAERVLIYFIGSVLVSMGGDGSMNGITTMMFIRGEAAPYYSLPYIILGVLSLLLTIFFSRARVSRVLEVNKI